MRLLALVVPLAAAHLAASLVPAQTPFAVGTRDVAWANTTGQGAAMLTARVHYPAAAAGANQPVLPRPGGWPVVVFLHGFALTGTPYSAFGDAFASRGFVVVLSNTSQFDNAGQERDGRALFAAVGAANGAAGGPFAGAFDLQRIALAGHSMGGGNVANVLAQNPGYRCGLAIAPVTPRGGNAALVDVPLAIVAGDGDTITPTGTNAAPYFAGLTGYGGLKSFTQLNGDATHTNLAGLFLSAGTATQVFAAVVATGLGFFEHCLGLDTAALEMAIGPTALAEPRLVALTTGFERPQVWVTPALRVGAASRVSVGAEPGLTGAFAAAALAAPTSTPVGELLLDPSSAFLAVVGVAGPGRRIDTATAVPNDPSFVGVQIALQAIGFGNGGSLRLGNAVATTVLP